jgi:hypothetical protein
MGVRDVLQIGIGRAEPPGLRADEAVAGMDAAGVGVDRLLQRFGIGRTQLGQLAPFEHLGGDLRPLRGQPFEDRLVGRVLPALALAPALVAELVEQDIAQLLGTTDSEILARKAVDFAFEPCCLAGKFL